jgi:adenylate cyclase class 2
MQETEAKFFVGNLDRVKTRLEQLSAPVVQERVLETNIRFDLPGGRLRSQGRVLRLRHDTEARLTYKSASIRDQGVLSREEIEFVVEDFEKAKRFLEALGYQKLVYYEKYRTTYEWSETSEVFASYLHSRADVKIDLGGLVHVMLDELPYGDFVEIEGETIEAIRTAADQLNLNWEAAIAASYNALFERVQRALKLSFQDLSFANFENIKIQAGDLGVYAAD